MKKHTVRNSMAIVIGLGLCTLLISAFQLWRIAKEPNTVVEFLPPNQWFSYGMAADGPKSVSITTVYGPFAVTTRHPR